MPIYEFAASTEAHCEHCAGGFELLLKLSQPRPDSCPRCAAPVKLRIGAPFVASGQAHRLQTDHLERHGFTQYRKAGGGVYEKTAGKGPDFIADDGN